jgi:DNA-binding response OmpR family regulator
MQYLVVTHDSLMEEVFRRILAEMGATVEFRGDAKSGLAALEARRFDVVAVDCDDVYQGTGLLRAAHASRPNKSSVVLAITSGETSAADAVDMGAQLVAAKPLPPDRARYELRRACQALASGQRRQRYPVRLPVFLSVGQVLDRRAEALNVSLGGIGLRVRDLIEENEIVHLRFWLPECATSIQARGEIAWSSPRPGLDPASSQAAHIGAQNRSCTLMQLSCKTGGFAYAPATNRNSWPPGGGTAFPRRAHDPPAPHYSWRH